ncbi:MAG TPA: histidine phosphatase family protein [Lachnospiraceae bacterium]|nr:histidine phosphatase family protein [Lachnospiraceae bacterium]
MRIYLVRHGETDWNVERRFQGKEDIELNETGIKQAHICGEALSGNQFATILTSPLLRAKRTAEIIGTYMDQTKVVIDERLIERDFGVVSGMLPKDREAYLASGKETYMEPFEHVTTRLMEALKEYQRTYAGKDILLVSHGGTINAILHVLSAGDIGTGKTYLKNTCISILDCDYNGMKIGEYNLSPDEYRITVENV